MGQQGTWRVGRKVGRTIYRQRGSDPSDKDDLIGMMDTVHLAQSVVDAVNERWSMGNQGIGWAVEQLLSGRHVYRRGWNGRGQWLAIKTPTENSEATLPYVYICTVQGDLVPWICSQTDLLAKDWEIT